MVDQFFQESGWTYVSDSVLNTIADSYTTVMNADVPAVVGSMRGTVPGNVIADVLTPYIPVYEAGREVAGDIVTVVADHIQTANEDMRRSSLMESKRAYDRARIAARQRAEEEQLPFEEVVINQEGDTIRIPGVQARQDPPAPSASAGPAFPTTGHPMPFEPF